MSRPLVLALGTFDGLHLGHRALIDRTLGLAGEFNYQSACYTFSNVPASFSLKLSNIQLMGASHKEEMLRKLGLEVLIMKDFDEVLMNTEPEDFIRDLVLNYNIAHMVVGKDFRFGKGGRGGSVFLKSLGDKYGYRTEIIDFVYDEEGKLSSSRLRARLREGDMSSCRHILGRNFSFQSHAVKSACSESNVETSYILKPDFDIAAIKPGIYSAILVAENFKEELKVRVRPSDAPALWEAEFLYHASYDFGHGLYELEFLDFLYNGDE